jgi:archaellum component FlaC
VNIDALILSIERLEELEEGIFNKNFYILNKELSKKSDFYIAEIQKNIKELKYYKTFLESKFNDLNDTQKVHLRLFKKIPRYYELSGAHQHLQLEK